MEALAGYRQPRSGDTCAVHVVAEDPEEYATAVVSFYGRGRLLICEGS